MTKTLTEQWREGTLTGGFYYIQLKGERWPLIDHTDYNLLSHKIEWKDFDWRAVEEVIDEVPSYEEYKRLVSKTDELEKKLEIATKALEELELKSDKLYRGGNDWSLVEQLDFLKAKCQETLYHLKEMEGVK